jgi:hypothetical protein
MAFVKIDISPEEAVGHHRALAHSSAYLYSQLLEELRSRRGSTAPGA